MDKYFMGIDTGTQGARIGICNLQGDVVWAAEQGWSTGYPKPGWAEQKPAQWWESIDGILTRMADEVSEEIRMNIAAVCVDSTSSTVIPVKDDGTPLTDAVMWMDLRAHAEAELINKTGDPILDYCGGEDSPEWFVPKVLWFKNQRPEIYKEADHFVEQLDWINYQLCGVWASSICNATCKGNYVNSHAGYSEDSGTQEDDQGNYVNSHAGYSEAFFRRIGLEDYREKFLDRVEVIGTVLGKIRPELAAKFGLNQEMLVVEGGIDAHIGMFGTNAITEGKLSVIMGTSFVHLGIVDRKLDMEGIWGPYEDAIRPGTWCVEGGQASAAGLVNWFVRNFNIEKVTEQNAFAYLADTLEETRPGAEGLVVLDFFQGNRTPYKDPYAKGMIYGLTMQHSWKHIYRAILEAVAFGTHNIISNYDRQGYHVQEIVASGGVTKNRPWLQIIADITGKKVVINRDSQAGVLGCCVIAAAMVCHDGDFVKAAELMVQEAFTIEPDMKRHEEYMPVFEKYRALYEKTKELNR